MSHQEERDAILLSGTAHDVFVQVIDRLLAVESELEAAKERLDRVARRIRRALDGDIE